MRNNQRRNNQTIQGCIGANLRVCPTMVNTIPTIIKQSRKNEQLRKVAHAGVPLQQAHTKPDNGRTKKQLTQPVETQCLRLTPAISSFTNAGTSTNTIINCQLPKIIRIKIVNNKKRCTRIRK
jgi:hypothetical protein